MADKSPHPLAQWSGCNVGVGKSPSGFVPTSVHGHARVPWDVSFRAGATIHGGLLNLLVNYIRQLPKIAELDRPRSTAESPVWPYFAIVTTAL